jgi:tRNA A37 threonylcarbamoyladenosine synthetase subunit TsaC/SUA5/YrdC
MKKEKKDTFPVYLAQTDTTAGLLSKDFRKLNRIKGRPENQPILREVDSLETLKEFARVPKKFRREIRKKRKVTYIYHPLQTALRVVDEGLHYTFLKKYYWLYSTSANPTGKGFDPNWGKRVSDIIVEDRRGFFSAPPSPIFSIGKRRKKRKR